MAKKSKKPTKGCSLAGSIMGKQSGRKRAGKRSIASSSVMEKHASKLAKCKFF